VNRDGIKRIENYNLEKFWDQTLGFFEKKKWYKLGQAQTRGLNFKIKILIEVFSMTIENFPSI